MLNKYNNNVLFFDFMFLFLYCSTKTQILLISTDLAKQGAEVAENDTLDMDFMSSIELIFKSLACMNASFLTDNNAHLSCSSRNPGVCVEKAGKIFGFIQKMENASLKQIVCSICRSIYLK